MFDSILGGCRLVREVGNGSFGTVFLATGERGEQVAVKRFHWACSPGSALLETENAMRLISTPLECTYLVRFFNTVVDPGEAGKFLAGSALVFEFCDSGTLHDLILHRQQRHCPFTPFEVTTIAMHLTTGLDALHKRKLVHRDIAPRNIFISRDRHNQLVFKIGDVGLCKFIAHADAPVSGKKYSLHAAPELLSNAPAEYRSDVFSLGLVIFEILKLKIIDVVGDPDALAKERKAVRDDLKAGSLAPYGAALLEVVDYMLVESAATRHTAASAFNSLLALEFKGKSVSFMRPNVLSENERRPSWADGIIAPMQGMPRTVRLV